MSDRELVQIDANQFATLLLRLDAISGRVGPDRADFSLHQILTHLELTLYNGFQSLAQGNGGNNAPVLTQILTALQTLDRKVDAMSSNIERIEKEAAELAEDVTQVRAAIDGLKASQAELQALVTSLQERVAKGQIDQARLDAAATVLEKVDDDLDAITLPGTPTPTPEG